MIFLLSLRNLSKDILLYHLICRCPSVLCETFELFRLLLGYYRFKGELYKGNFEPIIPEPMWKKEQRIRARTARKK